MLVLIRSIEGILAALLLGLAWIAWRRRARLGQPGRLLWVTIRLFLAGALVIEVNQVVLTAAGSYPEWLTWHWADWGDAGQWLFMFGLFGSAQGFIGALLGASLGAWGRRHRRSSALPSTVAP